MSDHTHEWSNWQWIDYWTEQPTAPEPWRTCACGAVQTWEEAIVGTNYRPGLRVKDKP